MSKHLKLYEIYNTIHLGWDRTAFLFYIGAPAAIIGKFFGGVGLLAVVLTVLFLYGAGHFHSAYERSKTKKDKRKSKRKISKKKNRNLLVTLW